MAIHQSSDNPRGYGPCDECEYATADYFGCPCDYCLSQGTEYPSYKPLNRDKQ